MNQFHRVLRVTVLAAACSLTGLPTAALAQRDPSPATSRPNLPRMPLLTMDQKVGMANHIFVGVGTRVFFVDSEYKEVPYESAGRNSHSQAKYALLEFQVERTLYAKDPDPPKSARAFSTLSKEPFGGQPSSYEIVAKRHIGRRGVYFGQMQTNQIRIEEPNGSVRTAGNVTLHRFIVYNAIEGPNENPLPLSYLPETIAAVERRIEREKREAWEAAAKKAPMP